MPPPLEQSSPSPRSSSERGEGWGEGQTLAQAPVGVPHPTAAGARVADARGSEGAWPKDEFGEVGSAAALSARVSDVRDPAGAIWRDGAFRRDVWTRAVDGVPLPDATVILTKKRWLTELDALTSNNAPLGLHLDAGERVDDIAADVARFAQIALAFPKFSDGRAFSTARLLRDKQGYSGEMRAVGNVLADQIPFMRRVGFDAFEVTHAPTRRALEEGRVAEVTLHYQPAGADEPPSPPAPGSDAAPFERRR